MSIGALPNQFGDLDDSGEPSAGDLVLLVNHLESASLPSGLLPFADADRDGLIDADDVTWIVRSLLREVGFYAIDQFARFQEPSSELQEGSGTRYVEVRLSGYAPGVLVNYQVSGGTATQGVDYANLVGATAVNVDRALIPIEIFDDSEYEGVETIELTLTTVSGFPRQLPIRHVVYLTDNEELWRGSLAAQGEIYADHTSVDFLVIREGGAVSGRLLGDTAPSIPSGDWNMDLNLNNGFFNAQAAGLPVSAAGNFFETGMERTIALDAVAQSGSNFSIFVGTYSDTYTSSSAPHLNRQLAGECRLVRVPDSLPDVKPGVINE